MKWLTETLQRVISRNFCEAIRTLQAEINLVHKLIALSCKTQKAQTQMYFLKLFLQSEWVIKAAKWK